MIGPEVATWCTTCQIHRATASRPTCPVCKDDEKRQEKKP